MACAQSDLVFINTGPNTTDPNLKKIKKKAIRTQAARRPPLPGDFGPSTPFKSASKWNRYQARTRFRQKAQANTFSLDTSVLEHPQDGQNAFDNEASPPPKQSTHPKSKLGRASHLKSNCAFDFKQAKSLIQRIQGAGWAAPFEPLGALNKVYFPLLLDHYISNLATAIPELDAGYPFILRTIWFPMVITNSATLNIVLLTSASHYVVYHQLHHNRHVQQILLHLKYQTLTCTNRLIHTLNQRGGSYSDAVIGAVARMASYEAMFGLPELYHMHMRGLQNMIRIKGGLKTLGLDGLLQRMVLWIDINSAFPLKSSVYFLPTVPLAGHVVMQGANPSGFLGVS